MIRINFDGELKVIPFIQTGECKWPSLFLPPGFIDRYLSSLTRDKFVILRFFNPEMFYIMGHRFKGNDLDNMFFHTIVLLFDKL
jgi:hypothetical protein